MPAEKTRAIVLKLIEFSETSCVVTLFTERGRGRGSGAPVEIHPLGIWTVEAGKVVAYRGYMDRDEGLRDANVCL